LETLEGETLSEYNDTGKFLENIIEAPLEVFLKRWTQKDNNIQRKRK